MANSKNIIAELNSISEENLPDIRNSTPIAVYYHAADNLLQQAQVANKSGDLERAYVLFMKFSTFVLQRIPVHLSYDHECSAEMKAEFRMKCAKVLKEIEGLQSKICIKYGISQPSSTSKPSSSNSSQTTCCSCPPTKSRFDSVFSQGPVLNASYSTSPSTTQIIQNYSVAPSYYHSSTWKPSAPPL